MIGRLQFISARIPASIALFLFFFSIYGFTMANRIQYGDEIEKYRVAQSIVDRGEFSIRRTVMKNDVGVGGRNYSAYELGQSAAQVPLYALSRWMNSRFPLPDANLLGQLFVGLLNPLATALVCVVFFKCGEGLGYRRETALALTCVFGLATIALPYSKGFAREGLLTLFVLLSFYAVLRFEKTQNTAWLLGAGIASGLLVFTKFIQGVVIPVLLAYVLLLTLQDQKRRKTDTGSTLKAVLTGSTIFLLPFIVFMIAQVAYAMARFGSPFSGIGGQKFNIVDWILYLIPLSHPVDALIGVTISPEKGLFVYSPPALLFFVAWFKWLRANRRMAFFFLALIVAGFATVLTRPDWDGGTWWGPRYLVQITPLFILPLGILDSPDDARRRLWRVLLGVLFALGLVVQLAGALSNTRDYLDIAGKGITLTGALDFLRHGALDSLVVYLSPAGFPVQINPFGIVLIVIAALLGAWIVWQMRHANAEDASPRAGVALAAVVLLVEFATFVAWIVAPYPQVLAAQANTKFVAANSFLADGRKCEAAAMYSLAIERGTTYQREAVARLDDLLPRARGTQISTGDLMAEDEKSSEAAIEEDGTVTISGEGSFKASAPEGTEVIARGNITPIPIKPSTQYEVSGWIRTENVYGAGFGSLTVSEDDGAYRHIRATDIALMDETRGWTRFQKTLTTLPTTQRLFIAAGLWKTWGTVWIDGLQVAQITADNPESAVRATCK